MAEAEDFNNVNDILNQWVNSGPKEVEYTTDPKTVSSVSVQLTNGEVEDFENATVADFGHRLVLAADGLLIVYPEHAVMRYQLTIDENGVA